MDAAKTYATQLANDLSKITMEAFFKAIHSRFYSEQDVSFMNYFVELTNHEDEFVVHHSKLVEYGIMTSNESSKVREKLVSLNMGENKDYELAAVRELRKQGGTSIAKHYHLTPEAFKKCLMRAQKRSTQSVDPVIYCDYYLLLEKVYKLYTFYEREYATKLLSMKDDKIDKLQATVEEQSIKMDQQSAEIRELLGYAKETVSTLHEVQDDLTETKEEVKIAKTYLQEKCITSTKNPANANLHHMFACTTYFANGDQYVKFVTGQKSYVDKTVDARVDNDDHKVIIKPFYNANGIDLRHNVLDEFNARRTARIKSINDENKLKDVLFNDELKKAIRAHNKLNPDNKRVFSEEKQKTPLVRLKDVSVKFSKLSFVYKANPHISFNEVLQIIIDVNGITQESPLQSDEE